MGKNPKILIDEPDFEWLMIDANHCKVSPMQQVLRAVIRVWAAQKGGNSKIHLAVDAHGMRVRVAVTAATTADCTQTAVLIGGIAAQCLQTDCGYDSNGL